jgi:hypothetical protein
MRIYLGTVHSQLPVLECLRPEDGTDPADPGADFPIGWNSRACPDLWKPFLHLGFCPGAELSLKHTCETKVVNGLYNSESRSTFRGGALLRRHNILRS